RFYTGIDGYMIAGPMFSQFMTQIAPAYGTEPFPEPPFELLYGTPQFQPSFPENPQQPNNQQPVNPQPVNPQPDNPQPPSDTGSNSGDSGSDSGNGNGNSNKGNG
ncbi:MAG: hypothetical protein ACLGIS_18925, partial [Actinomycetes bacterium]